MVQRKSNKKAWEALSSIKNNYTIQAGWFENSRYDDGTPIGGIAAVQNYGAKIPVTDKLRGYFGANFNIHFKKSTQYLIIPPTHFMENCVTKNTENWKAQIQKAWTSVFLGNIEPDNAMDNIGGIIASDIAQAIADVSGPPLSPITVRARLKTYKNQKVPEETGINKRLAGTGQMFNAVSHKVTKK